MSPDAPLSDAELVDALERGATIPADHAQTIFTDQGLGHRLCALRTIEHRLLLVHLSIIAVSLTGCLRLETAETAIGEAYVAPAKLELLEEIAPRAQVTATLMHGARVEILARHRRFAKVRGAAGASGWTDGRQLLSVQGMAIFRNQGVRASAIPPQGSATAADVLNVHITPYRGAPTFYKLAEGERVQLAGRSIMPRIQYVPPDEKSGQLVTAETLRDDWSLVCLKDQRCGWVLTSLLMFDLPDEIVQLAEGHRITAFFKLGETSDSEGKQRPIYLWTTSTGPPEQFQFDAFRVFAWNAARARYESTHRERNVRGYHPVRVEGGKIRLVYGAGPDGPVERHTFELRGRKLHLLTREPWQAPDQKPVFAAPLADGPDATNTAKTGAWQRVGAWVRSLRK
jgi:SH3-like domain-containing protein